VQLTELNHLLQTPFQRITTQSKNSKPKPTEDNHGNIGKTVCEVILWSGRFKLKLKQTKMTHTKCSK